MQHSSCLRYVVFASWVVCVMGCLRHGEACTRCVFVVSVAIFYSRILAAMLQSVSFTRKPRKRKVIGARKRKAEVSAASSSVIGARKRKAEVSDASISSSSWGDACASSSNDEDVTGSSLSKVSVQFACSGFAMRVRVMPFHPHDMLRHATRPHTFQSRCPSMKGCWINFTWRGMTDVSQIGSHAK